MGSVKKISKNIHSHTPKLIKKILFYSTIFGLLYVLLYIYNNTLFIKYIKSGQYTKALFEIKGLILKYGLIVAACAFLYLVIEKELNKFVLSFVGFGESIAVCLSILIAIVLIITIVMLLVVGHHHYTKMIEFLEQNIETHMPLFKQYCPLANTPHSNTEPFYQYGDDDEDNRDNDVKASKTLIIENFNGTSDNDDGDGDDEKLKYIANNCPAIQVFNDDMGEYQDLILADFYYSGCYNSLTYGLGSHSFLRLANLNQLLLPANNPINGYNMRMLHFKVDYDEDTKTPIITTDSTIKANIDFYTCMKKINSLAWRQPFSTTCILPLFIYLEFIRDDFTMFEYVNNTLVEIFNKRLIDKKYGYDK